METAITMPDGTVYPSIRQACAAEGVLYETAKRHADRLNVSISKATDTLRRNKRQNRTSGIEAVGPDGTRYRSIRAACKAENMNYTTIMKRLNAGMTFAQAIRDIRASSAKREVRVNGKMYPNVAEACRACGIDRRRITYLVRMKELTAENAFKQILKGYIQKFHVKPITDYKGREFRSVREFAKMYGLNDGCYVLKRTAGGKMPLGDILECIERRINASRSLIIAGFRLVKRVSGPYFKTIDPDEHECVMHIDELYDRHFAEIGFDGKGET